MKRKSVWILALWAIALTWLGRWILNQGEDKWT